MIFKKTLVSEKAAIKPKPKLTIRGLFHTYTAEELFVHPKRKLLLEQIRSQVNLSEEHLDLLYGSLLEKFAEMVQVIPSAIGGRWTGLLDEGLERANAALEVLREEGYAEPRFQYALFSAVLLLDVGKLLTQQLIMISDETGAFIEEWQPFNGSLVSAAYYRIRPVNADLIKLAQYSTPLLARQIMPQIGFDWLAEDHQILQMWLAILLDDGLHGSVFKHLLDLINKRLEERKLLLNETPVEVETVEPEETKIGEDFWEWLVEEINNGNFEDKVHMTQEGVLIEIPDIFEEFCETYNKQINWAVVASQFNSMGLTPLSGADYKFAQFFNDPAEKNQQMKTAVKQHFLAEKKKSTARVTKEAILINRKESLYLKKAAPEVDKKVHIVKTTQKSSTEQLAKIITKATSNPPPLPLPSLNPNAPFRR